MLHDWIALGFLRRALLAGILTAISCGLLSPYVVLRRMAFAGHGLSHAAFGGAAVAILLGLPLSLGGAVFAGILAVFIAFWTRKGELSEDSAIGLLVAASMAVGVICLALRKRYTQDIFSFLFGNILAVLPNDLLFSTVIGLLTVFCMLALARPLMAATFHEELAHVEGVPVERMRMLLFVLIAMNVVAAMKLVGAILVSALLVVPGALALLVSRRFVGVQIASLAVGIGSVLAGMAVSYMLDLPSGAVIALILFLAYGVARTVNWLVERNRPVRG
jgi:ABC-type Mn2+/Zn2+ transport system permease subunit